MSTKCVQWKWLCAYITENGHTINCTNFNEIQFVLKHFADCILKIYNYAAAFKISSVIQFEILLFFLTRCNSHVLAHTVSMWCDFSPLNSIHSIK